MQRIAEALNVSQQQISKDLGGLQLSSKPSRHKGGRPKSSGCVIERSGVVGT
jgi:hypothetical protein